MLRSSRVVFCLLMALTACASDGPLSHAEVRALNAARARWLASTVRQAYTYEVRQSCFCPPESVQWNTVTVRNDSVVDVKPTEPNGLTIERARWQSTPTVERLFSFVTVQDAQYLEDVRVQFDAQYGYPVLVELVASDRIADGGGAFYARNLRAASGNP